MSENKTGLLKAQLNNNKGILLAPDENFSIIPLPTVEVEQGRYERLIAAETELNLLKSYLSTTKGYCDIDVVKKIFNIKKGNEYEK